MPPPVQAKKISQFPDSDPLDGSEVMLGDQAGTTVKVAFSRILDYLRAEGISAVDKYYVHDQDVASSTWVIVHNLGKIPSVQTMDSNSPPRVIIGNVQHVDDTTATVSFGGPLSGKAFCN